MIDERLLVAFAQGYYDGRAIGTRDNQWEQDNERHHYNRGYDRGVFDYGELDTADSPDAEEKNSHG